MKYFYDLHIHTCLSPCADDEMTPCNIAGMAKIAGLDIIAITDHNTALNARAVHEASEAIQGATVIPAMELETEEGIHIILIFDTFDNAENASKEILERLPNIEYDTTFYGKQLLMDSSDSIIEQKRQYLGLPTDIPLYDVKEFAKRHSAICYPAHINRESNGILSILGGIDEDMGFDAIELNPRTALEKLESEYLQKGYKILYSSDAHNLEQIGFIDFDKNFIELEGQASAKSLIEYIIKRR